MASCYFYMAFLPIYILILGFTILVDYLAGIYIEKSFGKRKLFFLIASLIANIGVLAFFKYYNFLNDSVSVFMGYFGYDSVIPKLEILLPIGLSFHTFQAMSYTIEVYRGQQKAERNFGIYALYVMFYPQLVAGPIERPQNLLYQFYQKHSFDFKRIVEGLKLMIFGFFMKLVIADRLALYVDSAYNNVSEHSGLTFIFSTIFFSFQIYGDFAGYSLIAIGSARVMGFKLMTNFNRPYFSRSISEFWKRWHISLSTWFKDYLYISMGGNRVSAAKWYFNLISVFTISGLWHGANWTFIIWGALNGFYLVFAVFSKKIRMAISHYFMMERFPRINNSIQVFITFTLICFAWIFFRANSVTDAILIIKKILFQTNSLYIGDIYQFVLSIIAIIILIGIELFQEAKTKKIFSIQPSDWFSESFIYIILIVLILLIGVFDGGQFIYFQF